MEGRDKRDPGYDDWFDEPEPPTEGTGHSAREVLYEDPEDVWVLPEEHAPRRRRGGGRRQVALGGWVLTTTQIAIIGVSVLALFFAILAATGVFSTNTPPQRVHTNTGGGTGTQTHSTSTATNTTPAVVAPTTTLKPGDTGSEVKTLQRALAALGFSPWKPDGNYGPATKTAVQDFQTSKKLTSDGIVGPKTLLALQQALSG